MRKFVLFIMAFSLFPTLFAKSNFAIPQKNRPSAASCSGNADAIFINNGVVSEIEALGVPNDNGALIQNRGNQLGLDITDILQPGETYTIRWRRSTTTMDNPTFTVEESLDGVNWVSAAGSPFTETSTVFSNNDIVTASVTRYIRITTTNVYDLEVDAISYTSAECCSTFSPTITVFDGTCTGTIPNEDGSVTISGIAGAERADLSSARADSYDGDDFANAKNILGDSVSFINLQQNSNYILRIYEGGGACFNDFTVFTADSPETCPSVPAQLPWDGSVCGVNNVILQNGIAAITCGVTQATPEADRWAFGLMNLDQRLPSSGRSEETAVTEVYHHPSWHVDTIGNVFGTAINTLTGDVLITASANYGAGFLGNNSVLRYGSLAGGTTTGNDDSAAAGAIYKIDSGSGQASVFALLPQQSVTVTHLDSESDDTKIRTASGVGLGNIVYDPSFDQYFVSNMEDGRIYRLDNSGVIQDSYDPFMNDDGVAGISNVEELVYGLAIEPGTNRLFFGGLDLTVSMMDEFAEAGTPSIYSINLTSTGGFPGTTNNSTLPSGAAYDNYEQVSETFHVSIPTGSGFSYSRDYIYLISDLSFNKNDQLIVGVRVSTKSSYFTSYNHFGETSIVTKNGTTGLYSDNITELDISVDGGAAPDDSYGGVATYLDSAGVNLYATTSADILEEAGPHGVALFNNPPNVGAISPLAAISYGVAGNDPKGVGGDIEVWENCLEFDLALKKTLVTTGVIEPEDDVVFAIKVYNQGEYNVRDIEVRDYFPIEMRLNDSAWDTISMQVATRMISNIAPGDSATLNITLRINSGFQSTSHTLVNNAEIVSTSGGIDSDSPLVIINDGTTNELATDNDINDEAPGTPGTIDNPADEDDYDAAQIIVICPPLECLPVSVNPTGEK